MQLALRKTAASSATPMQRLACNIIKARLVSQYCHGGLVIDGDLYHITASRGMHCIKGGEWEPEKWHLFDLGEKAEALRLFSEWKQAKYDWVSLLAFVGLPVTNSKQLYCFEWCWLGMTGQKPSFRVTPEILLEKAWT